MGGMKSSLCECIFTSPEVDAVIGNLPIYNNQEPIENKIVDFIHVILDIKARGNTMKTDHVIDTVGKFCPVPIIETATKLKELAIGETVTVIADDEGIKSDMKSWCEMTGNEFLGLYENDGEIEVYVRKALD